MVVGIGARTGEGEQFRMSTADLPDAKAAARLATIDQETWELRRLIAALRGTWRIPSFAAAVLLILGFAGLGVLRVIVPTTTTFISQFHFTFATTGAGRYPNGVPFGINELIDPAILDAVYEQLDIARYGIDRERFYAGFSIRPFATTESETADRFRQQLLDRRLSFAERERVEQQLRNQLELASRGAAELSFITQSRIRLPVEIGRAIVQRVPFEWARQAIEKKGVLRVPGFSGSDYVVALASLEPLPLPLRIVAVMQASQRINDRLADLAMIEGISTARDPVTGKSIRDLARDVRDLELYRLNPLRAVLVGSRFHDGGAMLQQVVEQRVHDIDIADRRRLGRGVGDRRCSFAIRTGLGRPQRHGCRKARAGRSGDRRRCRGPAGGRQLHRPHHCVNPPRS
jgi:hypothetical protein